MRPTSTLCVEVMPVTKLNYDYNSNCRCPVSEKTSHIHLDRLLPTEDRLPQISNIYPARLRPRSSSTSPLTKRSKLHRERNSRKLVWESDMPSSSPAEDSLPPTATIPPSTETFKTGNLVVVSCPRGQRERSRSRSHPSDGRLPARCPSIVQVCRRQHEHWALVRRTRHRLTDKPQLLNLRRCRLTRTRAAQFTVHLDGAEGRSFTFEASSPELAEEWVQAFTPVESLYIQLNSNPRLSMNSNLRVSKPLDNVADVILEEDEDLPMSPGIVGQPVSSSLDVFKTVSSSGVVTETETYKDKNMFLVLEDVEENEDKSEDGIESLSEHFHEKDSLVNETVCPTIADLTSGQNFVDNLKTSPWGDAVIRDVAKARLRTSSLPVLYEEEEIELEP